MQRRRSPRSRPTDAQRARGWSRDWSAVWASHERKLASTRDLSPAAADAWRSREDVVSEDGGRVQFFDVTGGPLVRLAKERAMAEQVALESAALERARRALLPDVVRVANMPTSTLATGATIPLVGLGTWKSEPGRVRAAVETALKCGYRHVDCAAIYDNEGEVGEALARVFDTTKLAREDVFITSKLGTQSTLRTVSSPPSARPSDTFASTTSTCTSSTGPSPVFAETR